MIKFKVYETEFNHLKGGPLASSFKLLGEVEEMGPVAALDKAMKEWPNKLGYRLADGQLALDYSETLCVMCGIGKVGMWVGGNNQGIAMHGGSIVGGKGGPNGEKGGDAILEASAVLDAAVMGGPRRVIRVCPRCEGKDRVGKVSS